MTRVLPGFAAIFALGIFMLQSAPAVAASQCGSTPWEAKNGRSCKSIGLDSNKAVCRKDDKYAMYCDDTKTQIRTCVSNQRCDDSASSDDAASCPRHIEKERKSKRKCNAYEDGYRYGKRDAQDDKRDDYERWDDKYDRETEDYFKEGYRYGYRDYE